MEKLPGDYIAGFVDGEGCFILSFRRDIRHERGKRSGVAPIYFYWEIGFAIVLRADDKDILKKIKDRFGCGTIRENKKGHARLQITDINDLSNKIVPFFEKYPLYAKKKFDFYLWKEAVEIFKRNQRLGLNRRPEERGFHKTNWNSEDLKRLAAIHKEMQGYKSKVKPWKWLGVSTKVGRQY